jgi:diguanylate cyclase (GGDEF)-like protein
MGQEQPIKVNQLLYKLKQDLLQTGGDKNSATHSSGDSLRHLRPETFREIESTIDEITGLVNAIEKERDSLKAQLGLKDGEVNKVVITDNLTSLYNRHHLVSVLEREIARCQRYGHPLAMMMIDIDDLRSFNESYGQDSGDRMLSFAGNLIRENIRKFDRAFRYGGEEFIVVMPETDLTMAFFAAERIRKGFQGQVFQVVNKASGILENDSRTMSIGITYLFTYNTDAIDIEKLIERTEKAITAAKSKGGNICLKYEEQKD